jgi:hypothetical protein
MRRRAESRRPPSRYPTAEPIQKSFGRHYPANVEAHIDPQAAGAIGATAYASGNHVVFGGPPDLHTAAHEVAHVVQQRAGVSLYGGVGEEGDVYERHADAVADAVVGGRSAEPLLAALPNVRRESPDHDSGARRLAEGHHGTRLENVQLRKELLPNRVVADLPADSARAAVTENRNIVQKATQLADIAESYSGSLVSDPVAGVCKGTRRARCPGRDRVRDVDRECD